MPLPQFGPPSLGELRDWYVRYKGDENVRRPILEVQRPREQMPFLSRLLNFALAAAQRSGFECLLSGSALLHVAAERVSPECRRH